ncbi:MAG: thioredoxin family protein [Prevotella sp.]|nr:thioredoxin family protein [Prevotella sp.]
MKILLSIALLAFATMTGQAQEINSQSESIADTYWRNEATGDWIIGFAPKHVIYNNMVWDIATQTENKDAYTLTLNNGIIIKVGKLKNGLRSIVIGSEKPVVCSPIAIATLPDYPVKDQRKGFVDNNYQMGDSATLIGWMKDMPEQAWKYGREFEVGYENLFARQQISAYAKMDSLGRFSLKIPLINSSQVFIDWRRSMLSSLMEPGRTYFLLCDFKTDQKLFMGDDVRVQNELLAYPHQFANDRFEDMEPANMGAMQFKTYTDSLRSARMAELQERIHLHPNLSQRYIDYLTGYYLTGQGESMMQARFHMPGRELPQEYMDYVGQLWQNKVKPYTLYRDFSTFMRDYIDQLDEKRQIDLGDQTVRAVRRMEHQGIIKLTPEESKLLDDYSPLAKEMDRKLSFAKSHEESHQLIEAFERNDTVAKAYKLFDRLGEPLEREQAAQSIRSNLATIDSVGCDRNLRDIYLACYLWRVLDVTRNPLPPLLMECAEQEIKLPVALNTIKKLNDKYAALQNQDLTGAASLRPSTDIENMSDGEAILRKIIEPYKGRIIFLDVWGTWCGPCKAALKESHKLKEALKDYDIVYLYLANRSSDESWKNVIKEYNLTGDNCVHYNLPEDQQSAIEHYLKVNAFPTYKLIDRQGNIHDYDWVRANDANHLRETLAKLSK